MFVANTEQTMRPQPGEVFGDQLRRDAQHGRQFANTDFLPRQHLQDAPARATAQGSHRRRSTVKIAGVVGFSHARASRTNAS
jgi:hypothetical protein